MVEVLHLLTSYNICTTQGWVLTRAAAPPPPCPVFFSYLFPAKSPRNKLFKKSGVLKLAKSVWLWPASYLCLRLVARGYISYYLHNTPIPKPMLTFQRSTGFKPVPECIAPTLSSLRSVSVSLSESEHVTYCSLIQLSEISTCQSCHTASIKGGLNIFVACVSEYQQAHAIVSEQGPFFTVYRKCTNVA